MTRLPCIVLVLGLLASPAVAGDTATVERRLTLMGTSLKLTVEAPERSVALAASEAAVQALEAAEGRLSTWRGDTELARLNAAPAGEVVSLSPTLAAELTAARRCQRETQGAFDPAVGALVTAWGLRIGGRQPTEAERRRALAGSGVEHLTLTGATATRHRTDVTIEEGGFGKGAGLRAAIAALTTHGGAHRALLDLGGQVAVYGTGEPWRVDVAHPRQRMRPVATVRIDRGSLATSGTGVRGAHLLDPTTGRPATDFGSLTVWTEDPLEADCLSTGLYVQGPRAALEWATNRRGVEVLILETTSTGLAATATPGMAERLTRLAPDVSLFVWNEEETRAAGRSASQLSNPSPSEFVRP